MRKCLDSLLNKNKLLRLIECKTLKTQPLPSFRLAIWGEWQLYHDR